MMYFGGQRIDDDSPLYMIGVVSKMLGVHPQTLRLYEREGFVRPRRVGGQRLYSDADIKRLAFVINLTRDMGVNRAGVDIILRMTRRLDDLHQEVEQMLGHLEEEMREEYIEKIRRVFLDTEDDKE